MTSQATLAAMVLLPIATLLIYAVIIYNGLVSVQLNIDRAWSNIDVLLKQRHDELPRLVEVCRAHMAHEAGVFERLAQARASLPSAEGPRDRAAAEGSLSSAVRGLFAVAEGYPALTAQSSFQGLRERITEIENEIADRREFYNACVTAYNVRIVSFPDMFLARFRGLAPRDMFQVAESEKTLPPLNL